MHRGRGARQGSGKERKGKGQEGQDTNQMKQDTSLKGMGHEGRKLLERASQGMRYRPKRRKEKKTDKERD